MAWLFKCKIVSSLLGNCQSWIGLATDHENKLQDYQNTLMRKLLAAPQQWTPTSMIEMESRTMLMPYRIKRKKLCFVGKVVAKDEQNIWRHAPRNGANQCYREDIYTEWYHCTTDKKSIVIFLRYFAVSALFKLQKWTDYERIQVTIYTSADMVGIVS